MSESISRAKKHRLHKRIAIDIAGFGLVIIGVILSPVPGPGGIPLIIIGLAVLSQNYEWAQRLMNGLKNYIADAAEKSFTNDPRQQRVYDIISPLLIAIGLALLHYKHGKIWQAVAIIIITQGLVFLLGNRDRGKRLWRRTKQIIKR